MRLCKRESKTEERPDCNLFHVASAIVSAEMVLGLKDDHFGSAVSFTAMHTVVLEMLNDAQCRHCIYFIVIMFHSLFLFFHFAC